MKQTRTKAPTINFIVDLKEPGDYEQGWTLIQSSPKIYVSDSNEIIQADKIVIDSGIRNTIKKGISNPLENFYKTGDKVRVITKSYDVTGVIDYLSTVNAGSQKEYISLNLLIKNPGDILFRSDIFDEFTINSILSFKKNILIYSGILSISKIYDQV